VALTEADTSELTLRAETEKPPLLNNCPACCENCGAGEDSSMLPPILSPPTLTGVMPATTRVMPTCDGAHVGHGRVHLVTAGGGDFHAIQADLEAVGGKAVEHRQCRDATGCGSIEARLVAQQRGAVSACRSGCGARSRRLAMDCDGGQTGVVGALCQRMAARSEGQRNGAGARCQLHGTPCDCRYR
jgi:hypothetical protein